jgi:hypothetical protein
MTMPSNLLPEPPATLLPDDADASAALAQLPAGSAGNDPDAAAAGLVSAAVAAARFPASSAAWAELADRAYVAGDMPAQVASYAYARTGYHRGLDALRRSGWKGHGPVPWSHKPNRGFLRCLAALARAATAIGESDEAARCAQFLRDCDPAAADALHY